MSDPSLSADDYKRLHEFRYLIRRFLLFSETAARSVGLEPQQHQLLLTVRAMGGDDGIPVRVAAERLQIRHNTAVELVDRAAAAGLVERTVSPADRRSVIVRLTAKGDALLRQLSRHHLDELRALAPELAGALAALAGTRGAEAVRPRPNAPDGSRDAAD